MDHTGERYIPHLDTIREIACEHWHRYLYAAQFVADKVVLDIASGEGYGSHYLAGVAKHVVGVEADAQAVRHASSKYVRPNLEFRCGSAEVIPIEGKHVFDAVVCFETIEHLWEGQQLTFLREIERLLKPEGVFLVSTPNKLFYSDRTGYKNEYHRREFYYDDYLSLLRKQFRTVHLLGQKVYPASYIWQPAGPSLPLSEYQLGYSDGQFGPVAGNKKELLYLLAVCSNGAIEAPSGSLLVDVSEASTPVPPEVPAEENENSQQALADLRRAFEEHVREEATRQETIQTQQHVQALTQENESYQRQITELQCALAEQQGRADALAAQVELGTGREKELRKMLLDAHDQLLRRDEEIQIALAQALQQHAPVITGAVAANQGSVPGKHLPYQLLLHRIREVVRNTLPLEAKVLVISKGDGELLKLTVQPGWHFPQNERGVWAGYNPADSAAAIRHLEELRAKGADYLLIPATSLWWLDYYGEFREHLKGRYREVVRQNDVCVIFALGDSAETEQRQYQQLIQRIREAVRNTLPVEAKVLVVSKGDEELLKLEDRKAEHFPQLDSGAYAGHYPADSAEAIAHLETLHNRCGAQFLLFPTTSLWWLEHYAEFRRHLEARYSVVLRQEDTCLIFALGDNRESNGSQTQGMNRTLTAASAPD